eukprot:2527543-Pyramimonas_sp.AAC.2
MHVAGDFTRVRGEFAGGSAECGGVQRGPGCVRARQARARGRASFRQDGVPAGRPVTRHAGAHLPPVRCHRPFFHTGTRTFVTRTFVTYTYNRKSDRSGMI